MVLPSTQERTNFLSLPGEIRNALYRTQLDTSKLSFLLDPKTHRRQIFPGDQKPPALFLVNKQIRHEALTLFYGESDAVLNIWPKTLDGKESPKFAWLGGLDDGERVRMFGRIKMKCEAFTLHIVQNQRDSAGPPRTSIETFDLHPEMKSQDLQIVHTQLLAGLEWIFHQGEGLTPRCLRAMVWWLLYVVVMDKVKGKKHDLLHFLKSGRGWGKEMRKLARKAVELRSLE